MLIMGVQQLDSFGVSMVIESFHISVCMKPIKSDFVANLLEHGVAGINIDESRVFTDENLGGGAYAKAGSTRHDGTENWRYKRDGGAGEYEQPEGRFPDNVMHDGSEIMDLLFPDTGFSKGGKL